MSERYWIGLGANLGDRLGTLQGAVDRIAARGARVEDVSPVYETAPRDVADQPAFLNAAARVRTEMDPPALLALLKDVERELGREPGGRRFGPRPIDCDILLREGGPWRGPGLEVPHPRLTGRRFALVPALDLDPGLRLPGGRGLADAAAAIDPAEQPVSRVAERLVVPRPPEAAGGP